MSKSYRPPDYAEYHFSLKEGALAVLEGMFVVAMIGYFSIARGLPVCFFFPYLSFL